MKPIDIMIAGAQKAGTTSFQRYLSIHPLICAHAQREFAYFILDEVHKKGYKQVWKRYFEQCTNQSDLILAKNVTVMYSQVALDRLFHHNPDCKIILLLRNPVERAYSAFWFALLMGRETISSFDEAVWLDPAQRARCVPQENLSYLAYLENGLYARHIRQIYKKFPRENVGVYIFDDFRQDPASVCRQAFAFLGISPIEIQSQKRYNVASLPRYPYLAKAIGQRKFPYLRNVLKRIIPDQRRDRIRAWIQRKNRVPYSYPPMNPETKEKLIAFFEPHNRALEQLLGIDLSSWNG